MNSVAFVANYVKWSISHQQIFSREMQWEVQSRWKDPRTPRSGGGLTYAQGLHVTYGKNFLGVQMYDGCCSVR